MRETFTWSISEPAKSKGLIFSHWQEHPGYGNDGIAATDPAYDVFGLCSTFYVMRHHAFYKQGGQKHDRFDRVLCAGLIEDTPYQTIEDVMLCIQRKSGSFPMVSSRLLLLLMVGACLTGGLLMRRYHIQKTAWLQQLEESEQYLVLLPYHADELYYYRTYLEGMDKQAKDGGRREAFTQIMRYRDAYQLEIPEDVFCYLLYEAVLSEDMDLVQQVGSKLRPVAPAPETAKVLRLIDALAQQEMPSADIFSEDAVRTQWNLALLALSEQYAQRFQAGYEEAISLCEWLQSQAAWQGKQLQQTKEHLQHEQSKDALLHEALTMEVIDQLCTEWTPTIENRRRLIALYMAVFDQLPDQIKPNHRSILQKAEQLFVDLQARTDGTTDAIGRQLQYLLITWG